MGQFATVAVVVASFGLMYVICIRPMRRGHGSSAAACCSPRHAEADRRAEIADLTRQITELESSQNDHTQ